MKVRIDTNLCSGDELCVDACPEVFVMQDEISTVKVSEVPAELEEDVRDAADSCPTEAIIIEE